MYPKLIHFLLVKPSVKIQDTLTLISWQKQKKRIVLFLVSVKMRNYIFKLDEDFVTNLTIYKVF